MAEASRLVRPEETVRRFPSGIHAKFPQSLIQFRIPRRSFRLNGRPQRQRAGIRLARTASIRVRTMLAAELTITAPSLALVYSLFFAYKVRFLLPEARLSRKHRDSVPNGSATPIR